MDVARLAQIRNLKEQLGLDEEMIYLYALLHDIGRMKEYEQGISHAAASAEFAGEIFATIGYPKEKGAIILEDGGDVDWLLKTIDDTALENYKNRLREDIHTGANVPHMCDESFGGNLSGVAISYKLWGLEQICSIKERKFKKGLQRRIELITNILNIMGHNYDYRDIVPKFRRNRPQNDMETAQIVTMLANDLSRETRLQLMPGVENVQDELRKLEEEKNKEQEDFGVYKNFTKAFQGAADRTEAVTDEPEGT